MGTKQKFYTVVVLGENKKWVVKADSEESVIEAFIRWGYASSGEDEVKIVHTSSSLKKTMISSGFKVVTLKDVRSGKARDMWVDANDLKLRA
ncbi:hypothetical protein MOD96_02335 [Bacillus sp. S17B2]|uniref:hypothetical protein n=1 Tax=Bacillus sp. S17B2 TaxID=2918907 RepID=UPI0022816F66|nr:hypothetical protein [Bacillus sp. S17B2]